MLEKLEEDADNVLNYMASNGLVANPSKTSLIFMGHREDKDQTISIKIGDITVTEEQNAKLIGVTFDNNLKWITQLHGKGGVIPALNQRLFQNKYLLTYLL